MKKPKISLVPRLLQKDRIELRRLEWQLKKGALNERDQLRYNQLKALR